MHLLFAYGQRNATTSTASVATEESTTNAKVSSAVAYENAVRRSQLRLGRERQSSLTRFRTVDFLLFRSNSLNGPRDIPTPGQQQQQLNADYEFEGQKTASDSSHGGSGLVNQDAESPKLLKTDYEFECRRLTQSDSARDLQNAELVHLPNTDYEFQGKLLLSDSGHGSSSGRPSMQVDFNQQVTSSQQENSRSTSSQPKFEVDFKQAGAQESSTVSVPPKFEIDFRQKSDTEGKRTETTDDTRDGNESETKEIELETGVTNEASEESQEQESDGDELAAELEGESHQFPMPPPRILTKPMAAVKTNQSLVFGHLSIMVTNVSDEAMLIPLSSPALADLLDNGPKYRAIALRCACELVFTRRIIVKRVVKWCRYAVLLIRGPSDAAVRKFRQCLESANRAFHLALPFDVERPRPRLLASETMPDNLNLAMCADRLGPASATWERQLPLEMPQRKLGKPLHGKQPSKILPNNRAISPVLAYVYPKWGFQTSKPIPNSQLFEAAVDEALELEKRQTAELKK